VSTGFTAAPTVNVTDVDTPPAFVAVTVSVIGVMTAFWFTANVMPTELVGTTVEIERPVGSEVHEYDHVIPPVNESPTV
jgi:hypothetical protein